MKEVIASIIREAHISKFINRPLLINAPGRANIIGEHTDYNKGFALPFAINKSVILAISTNKTRKLNIRAHDINEDYVSETTNLVYSSEGWARYFINVLVALDINIDIGLDITFGGNLPIGIGVSSSSAITCGFLFGLNHMFSLNFTIKQQIELASKSENGIGLNGGKMDQIAIYTGNDDIAIYLDFAKNHWSSVPLEMNDHTFYLIESGQKHSLVETEYNDRRKTCESAFQKLKIQMPDIKTFSDISEEHIAKFINNKTEKRRCLHVIQENERVKAAKESIINSEFINLGHLMTQTHHSLSQLYEVSTPEIDWLVSQTLTIGNVLGSRIMGGGFGGCTISLSHGPISEVDKDRLATAYKKETNLNLMFHEIIPSRGVSIVQEKE